MQALARRLSVQFTALDVFRRIRGTALTILASCIFFIGSTAGVSAAVIINEFAASSDTLLADEDGDFSDWIELYNTGSAVNLQGWYLTDDDGDLVQWTLPAITLGPDEYRVIFASGKNRSNPAGELHTNFKLGKGGEYLALTQPDGTTVESDYAPEYPPQFTDITYGQIPGAGVGYLQSATPGAQNSARAIPGVEFTTPSGVFTGSLQISLSTDIPLQPGEEIRYTLNGSQPGTSSTLYAGPFTIVDKSRIRARVFRGTTGGRTTTATFIEVTSSVASFTSNLPLIVVETFNEAVSTDDVLYTSAAVAVIDRTNGTAQISDVPDFAGFSGIRIRGSSSSGFPKKQYKLELWDDSEDDFDASLLGLGSESDWVIYAPGRYDRSMIANPLMYGLAAQVGLPAMQTQFVELYLNDGSGAVNDNDYDGLYVLTESIKIDNNRVDIEKMAPTDTTLPAISGGYILARDRGDSDKHSFFTTRNDNNNGVSDGRIVVHRPKLPDLNGAQINYIENFILDFEAALYGPDPDNPVTGYSAYIDVSSWVDAHMLRLLAMDPDTLRLSNYLYKPRGDRLYNAPLWDFDRTLNSDDTRDNNPELIWAGFSGVDPFKYSWWEPLFESSLFNDSYRTRWHSLRQTDLSQAALFARIDALQAEISQAYPREDARWGSVSGYGSRYGDLDGEIAALKSWLTLRLAFLDTVILSPSITELIGPETGTPFSLSCRENEVLIGVTGRSGSAVDQVRAVCSEVNPVGQWTGVPQVRGSAGGTGGSNFTRQCPANWAVTAIAGRAGTRLDQLDVLCRVLTSELNVSGQVQSLGTIGGNGGTEAGPFTCINDQPANGLRGRAGATIVQLGLTCGTPVPTAVESKFSLSDLTVNENDGTATIEITLNPPSTASASIGLFTRAGTATGGSDYYGFTQDAITFNPGDTVQSATLTLLDDTIAEMTETLQTVLFNETGASIDQGTGTVTIIDNDVSGAPVFSIEGVTANEADGTASATISLSAPLATTSEVTVFTRAVTATGGQDYYGFTRQVSFAPGETQKAVEITLLDDNIIEGDESLTLIIVDPIGAPIDQSIATVTLLDDDSAGAATLSLADITATESDGIVTATIILSPAQAQTVTVGIHTRSDSAQGGSDFYGFTELVTFAPGVISREVPIQLIDDSIVEPTETLFLRLYDASGADIANADGLGVVTINDDD